MIDNMQVSRNLMLLRLKKGLSQQNLAELCNVTHQAVSKWENGTALPDMQVMLFLSKYYDVSMEDILTGSLSTDEEERNGNREKPQGEAEKRSVHDPDLETQPFAAPIQETLPSPHVQEASSASKSDVPVMTWDQIIKLAPFASRDVLGRLAYRCVETLDESRLCELAPFLPSECLERLVKELYPLNPDLVFRLAPFLNHETVDWLIMSGGRR